MKRESEATPRPEARPRDRSKAEARDKAFAWRPKTDRGTENETEARPMQGRGEAEARPRQGRCEAAARPRRRSGCRDRGQIAAVAVSGRGHAGRRVTMHRGHCQAFIAPRRDPSTRPARPRITSTDRCNIHNYDTNTNRNPTTLQNIVSADISRPLSVYPLSFATSLSLSLSLADFRLMLKTALFCRRFRFYVAARRCL